MSILEKSISSSEKKWTFIQIPKKLISKFPEEFDLFYNEKVYSCKINGVGRIISKKLFSETGLIDGDTIKIEEKNGKFSITFKQGIKR